MFNLKGDKENRAGKTGVNNMNRGSTRASTDVNAQKKDH
jgi:hypothetical protein